MPAAEYAVYNNAITQTDPKAKAAALEAYLTQYPQSSVKAQTLGTLMQIAVQLNDPTKALDAADRLLQVDPNNLQALTFEAYFRDQAASSLTDNAAKQSALDAAAGYAQKGLTVSKPASMSEDDFKKQQATAMPIFYSAIGAAALNRKDNAAAIDAYKKEINSVPEPATHTVPVLPDIYQLALAYELSTPPDYLDCAFYAARFVAYAPEPYKSQIAPTARYCYHQYHGHDDDGYDAFAAAAQANVNPPDGLFASVKPAPTPAEQIHTIIASTPDLATLAIADKEMVFQYGSPEDAAKVWDTIKGKSFQLSGTVIASTPTQLQVAVSDNAVQTKTADFTVNLTPPDALPELKEHATPAEKLAYKRKEEAAQKQADALAAATAVGQTVTFSGTYDSFTSKPLMITMSDGEVVLPKAAKPAAPVHHTAPAKKQ
jgi:tetratricopeptide (TPR) repeat protein